MKKAFLIILILLSMTISVRAMEFSPPDVPDSGAGFMPEEPDSFGEGLWFIFKQAVAEFLPQISHSAVSCLSVIAVLLLVSVLDQFSSASAKAVHLASSVMLGLILLNPAYSLISLGVSTVTEMSEYGKLLLPVLTGALAAQGGVTSSGALYAIMSAFSAFLITLATKIIVPMLYIYFCLSLIIGAIDNELIKNMQNFIKWLIIWSLKITLYIFMGVVSITGVVSGTADASAVKAMKLTISGMVPVVGGIISDASETILISAGVMKGAAGIYGILAIIAIFVGPFLKIGCQYLMLKATGAVCSVFSAKKETDMLKDISTGMGLLLAMTGTVCLVLLIGAVCFMRGVA